LTIGPSALVEIKPPRLHTIAVARWRSLCGHRFDWIELVRP
jgi:hypothetical protein